MYVGLTVIIFHCHVSLLEGTPSKINILKPTIVGLEWMIFPFQRAVFLCSLSISLGVQEGSFCVFFSFKASRITTFGVDFGRMGPVTQNLFGCEMNLEVAPSFWRSWWVPSQCGEEQIIFNHKRSNPSYEGLKAYLLVSNIFYFHPYLGKIPNLTNIFQMGWNPPTSLIWRTFQAYIFVGDETSPPLAGQHGHNGKGPGIFGWIKTKTTYIKW